jgi:hypothetical protein
VEGLTALGRFEAHAVEEACAALRRDGAVVLDRLWSADAIDALRATVMAQHPEFADKALVRELQDTGTGRFIAPIEITSAIAASGVLTHPALDRLFADSLSSDWVYEAFGMMMTQAGAPEQKGHRDAPELFPDTPLGRVLPPFALTVAIPLVDVAADNGPTAILPGSHRFDPAACSGQPAIPDLPRGSVAVWTFSTIHWGMANATKADRPALYITVCRPFWSDPANFAPDSRRRLVVDPALRSDLGPRFARAHFAA